MQQLSDYIHVLDEAISLTEARNRSRANLIISNFFFQKGGVTEKDMQQALLLTLRYRRYVEANQEVRSYIAQCLYLVKQVPEDGPICVRKLSKTSFEIAKV